MIREVLDSYRKNVHGMVHCSGGGQTKVLHFIDGLHIVKDNMFEVPMLFDIIQKESGTPWEEMYRVFNMGHRMELYVDEAAADGIIAISRSQGVEAQVIGRVEASSKSRVTIRSDKGEFEYNK